MNYNNAIEVTRGIFWVGYNDEKYGLHSNPYLIVDGDEAVLIDGGSRPDFSIVMSKILQIGIHPNQIVRLIYHHYDPDLVGSVSNLESIISNNELKILSQRQNNVFIQHYSITRPINCINQIRNSWGFRSGRRLKFINTPYAHSPGSFVTYDEDTKTLFSSDLFGAYGSDWDLFLSINSKCKTCNSTQVCPIGHTSCFMPGIIRFHQVIMTSTQALRHALDEIKQLEIEIIAPQHGSIIKGKDSIEFILNKLYNLTVGIDTFIEKGGHLW